MSIMQRIKARTNSFGAEEDGAGTAWSLMLLSVMAMLGGYAIDVSNVMTERTNLQMVSDAAAHAALVKREFGSVDDAKAAALDLASRNMPVDNYGNTVNIEEVIFGTWNDETKVFTPDASSRSGVRVIARQEQSNGNAVPVFLLQFVGLDDWDVATETTYITYHPTCLKEGFVAEDTVDIQSNNIFKNGFCIHSNNYVSLNSNNYFEPGTVVSMPDLDDIELPNSGYKTNTGLKDALREGSWNIRIVERIDDIITGLQTANPQYVPDYITNTVPLVLSVTTIGATTMVPGRMYTRTCSGNQSLTVASNVILRNVVLVTNCAIRFNSGSALEDAIIATTNIGAKSIAAPSGMRIGKNDNCAAGGGAQVLTMGSFEVASGLQMFGGQILAKNDIQFAANANGIKGAAMVAGGTISGTSNMAMGYCGSGMEDNFHANYFKMVQ